MNLQAVGPRWQKGLEACLAVQVFATGMTAAILAVSPATIPSQFGVKIGPEAYPLAYFYGAAELSVAVASAFALSSRERRLLRVTAGYSALYQGTNAAAAALALASGAPVGLVPNLVVHVVISALFVALMRPAARAERRA